MTEGIKKKLRNIDIEDVYTLSPMQEGILFHYLVNPNDLQYYEQVNIKIYGEIDEKIFKSAWDLVIKNNEILRSIFRWEKLENPVQLIMKNYDLQIRIFNLDDDNYKLEGISRDELIKLSVHPLLVDAIQIYKESWECLSILCA